MRNTRMAGGLITFFAICIGVAAHLGNGQPRVGAPHEFAFTQFHACGTPPNWYDCVSIYVTDADAIDPKHTDLSGLPPGTRVVLNSKERIEAVGWSPDARQLAYLVVTLSHDEGDALRPTALEIRAVNLDGSHDRRITRDVLSLPRFPGLLASWRIMPHRPLRCTAARTPPDYDR